MSRNLRRALILAYLISFIMLLVTTCANHPDMSETRLLLEFWPMWLLSGLLGIIALWLLRSES